MIRVASICGCVFLVIGLVFQVQRVRVSAETSTAYPVKNQPHSQITPTPSTTPTPIITDELFVDLVGFAQIEGDPPGCRTDDWRSGFRVYVNNNGTANAGTFVVTYPDGRSTTVWSLDAGETTAFWGGPEFIIDSTNLINESNEDNNSFVYMGPTPTPPRPCTPTPTGTITATPTPTVTLSPTSLPPTSTPCLPSATPTPGITLSPTPTSTPEPYPAVNTATPTPTITPTPCISADYLPSIHTNDR